MPLNFDVKKYFKILNFIFINYKEEDNFDRICAKSSDTECALAVYITSPFTLMVLLLLAFWKLF